MAYFDDFKYFFNQFLTNINNRIRISVCAHRKSLTNI